MRASPKNRQVKIDNLGTHDHPTPRFRIATPLTPHAVRQQMLTVPAWLESGRAEAWLEQRRAELSAMLTPLDLMLTEEEAWALERYCDNEQMLAGTVRGSDYSGARGRGSGGSAGPLPDDALEGLAAHAEAKKRLRHDLRGVLLVFLAMQWTMDGAPSPEQAAGMLGLQGGNRWQAWHDAVKDAAADLVRVRY